MCSVSRTWVPVCMLASPLPLSCTPNHGMLKEGLDLIHLKHLPMCVQNMHLYGRAEANHCLLYCV